MIRCMQGVAHTYGYVATLLYSEADAEHTFLAANYSALSVVRSGGTWRRATGVFDDASAVPRSGLDDVVEIQAIPRRALRERRPVSRDAAVGRLHLREIGVGLEYPP